MQGMKRKIVYATMFEVLAIAFSSIGLFLLTDKSLIHVGVISVVFSTLAFLWNYFYNSIFEMWESKQVKKGRSFMRRIIHTTGFQIGMVSMIVPILAWNLDISLSSAFVMNLGFLCFFSIFGFIYTFCFDKIFGLPIATSH